jgi:hypothetical protein
MRCVPWSPTKCLVSMRVLRFRRFYWCLEIGCLMSMCVSGFRNVFVHMHTLLSRGCIHILHTYTHGYMHILWKPFRQEENRSKSLCLVPKYFSSCSKSTCTCRRTLPVKITHVYMQLHTCIYLCWYTFIFQRTLPVKVTHMYVQSYTHARMFIHIHWYIRVKVAQMYAHAITYIHTHTHTYTHTHIHHVSVYSPGEGGTYAPYSLASMPPRSPTGSPYTR